MPRIALHYVLPACLALTACTGTTNSMSRGEPDASNDARAGSGGEGGRDSGADARLDAPISQTGWLTVRGNKITTADGKPLRVRGANLGDTRSCNACTGGAPNPDGLKRWADELVDNWGATFVRFLLESYQSSEGYRTHYRNIVDDPGYYADIQEVVNHITSKPGVYVMVTMFIDSTMNQRDTGPHSEWPTEATMGVYRKLAEAFAENPQVLFGLMNEPHDPPALNSELAGVFNRAITEIRTVEKARRVPQHIIVAQAAQEYARDVSYWITNPLTAEGGTNIAYEIHPYNPKTDFDRLVVQPSQRVPLIIGEFGPFSLGPEFTMDDDDILALMDLAEENDIPYAGWMFHQRCPPSMLKDEGTAAYDGCGFVGAGTAFTWQPTAWGTLFKNRLAQPWRQ
jgi:endoglucanase